MRMRGDTVFLNFLQNFYKCDFFPLSKEINYIGYAYYENAF